jgi:hypothetical protein
MNGLSPERTRSHRRGCGRDLCNEHRRARIPSRGVSLLLLECLIRSECYLRGSEDTAVNQSRLRRIGPPADVDHLIPYLLKVTKLVTGA